MPRKKSTTDGILMVVPIQLSASATDSVSMNVTLSRRDYDTLCHDAAYFGDTPEARLLDLVRASLY